MAKDTDMKSQMVGDAADVPIGSSSSDHGGNIGPASSKAKPVYAYPDLPVDRNHAGSGATAGVDSTNQGKGGKK